MLSLTRVFALACLICGAGMADARAADAVPEKVSYYQHIRPILQAHCQGCHQPAKAGGGYVMTAFDRLTRGGDSGSPGVTPGKLGESYLVEQITPDAQGKAAMPKGKPPLHAAELELIKRWIAQGAVDDTPAAAKQRYDAEHHPEYSRPPVITAIDYSPDGRLLAIAGFHEVLLTGPEGGELLGRLVGVSERIESVRFSPDGAWLAVAGGLPGRMGEIQVWNVAERKLVLSRPVTNDTVYDGSWSPDGRLIAFGGADNILRAIEAGNGQQVLQQGAHNDWVLGTAFTPDGSHLVSVSRDMTVKLTEVPTQRFVDNITSITPGALRGGMQAVAMHPQRDEVVVGGADGDPKVYRIHRKTARRIGDDDNMLRSLPGMTGRIFSLAFSRDGARIAACSALDGAGQVYVFSYNLAGLPDAIKAIQAKKREDWSGPDKDALENYYKSVPLVHVQTALKSNTYTVAFRPDGKQVAAAGADGVVRLIDVESGLVVKEFSPAPISAQPAMSMGQLAAAAYHPPADKPEAEALPSGVRVTGLDVQPSQVRLSNKFEYAQLLVTAQLDTGDRVDVSRSVQPQVEGPGVTVNAWGLVRAVAEGTGRLTFKLGEQSVVVPFEVTGLAAAFHPDFIRDVNPILSRLGCNQGTCHGAAKGKNGFKLSLRGYDPLFDIRALTDDLASRRVNLASPDDSLMLLKPTGAVPHVGGTPLQPGEPSYELMRAWIADGVKLDLSAPRVVRIEVAPQNPVVQQLGARQQIRVLASYADGRVRDVTQESFLESGNTEVAAVERQGLVKALRRGEAPILVRYEGAYAATTLTVMGDRTGFAWRDVPTYNKLDELVVAKWQRMKIQPSEVCSDAEFIRRVTLDLTGLPPTADQVRAFLADPRESRQKREEWVDGLIGSNDFIEEWSNKWADLLQVNRKFLGTEGAAAFRKWIREQVAANTPYDRFAASIVTASGSNKENPAASYYKILREPAATLENTTHLFLAIRFNCNKCHDHPFERWTQDQYYQSAAYFAQYELKKDPAGGDQKIAGTAVEGEKPLYELVVDKPSGEINHERTGQPAAAQFPFACRFEASADATRRQQFSAWLTSRDNPYFAKSYVNRLWGYLFGVGIVEPIDDIRAGNPASNPELLDYLTAEFLQSGFNVRHMLRLICTSRTYQLSFESNPWNVDDRINYSHALPRRLPAEVLYDAVHRVTGATSKLPGLPPGTRAAALPDSGIELPSGFLNTFGRPARESACECERSSGLQLGPVMALISGPTVADAIADPDNDIKKLTAALTDNKQLVDELLMRILNRPSLPSEVEAFTRDVESLEVDHRRLMAALQTREADSARLQAEREQSRLASIAKTQAELSAHEKEIAPREAERERQRQADIAQRQTAVKEYDGRLAAKLAEWEGKQLGANVEWIPLLPSAVQVPNDAKAAIEGDRAVLVTGKGKGVTQVTLSTQLKNITALRLEMLADERLPKRGPGLSPSDGNFVLNELEVFAAPAAKPEQTAKVELHRPLADFSQENFGIQMAVDGNTNGNGWAVSPTAGYTHWATFETKQPFGHDGGSVVTIKLHQNYSNGEYLLGRFRISVAVNRQDVGLTLPDELRGLLSTPAEKRPEAAQANLTKYFRSVDAELRGLEKALAESQKALSIDPHLQDLQEKLELVSRPVPPDQVLLQLQKDAKMSEQQLSEQRLTAAQDLVWALINSPSFLFNR